MEDTRANIKALAMPGSAHDVLAKDQFHLTDTGNARRVIARHGRDLLYCHPWKSWLTWDGRRWLEDQTAEVVRRIKETQGMLYRTAAKVIGELKEFADDEERKEWVARLNKLLKHLLAWESARSVSSSEQMMRSEEGVPILPMQLDTDPMLLNVLNGTIDLRTGELHPHQREDLLTKLAPVEYAPEAECPRWLKFLDRVMGGNADLIDYLRRVTGYWLTGDVGEQSLWFFHGSGANGKSTYLTTVLEMLGDYGMQSVSELLMVRNSEAHPTERADLFGRRMVATIETEEGKRMAESLMKQMTGGDKIRARRMRQDFFEFHPTHKLVMAANHKPVIRGADFATWRRIKMVPFTVTIQDGEKDPGLPDKLREELPGILAWAVRGCLEWQQNGSLGEPDEVRQATADYQAEMDAVANFIGECCVTMPEARCRVSLLLEKYQEWSGDRWMTSREFNRLMESKGYPSKRSGHGGQRFYHGVGLPAEETNPFGGEADE